uniref:Hds1 n=1 Tax=Arundo donax TaxID=35708 RepID=A0A0A9B499_ARUDO
MQDISVVYFLTLLLQRQLTTSTLKIEIMPVFFFKWGHPYLKVRSLRPKIGQSPARINLFFWWFCEGDTDCVTQAIH